MSILDALKEFRNSARGDVALRIEYNTATFLVGLIENKAKTPGFTEKKAIAILENVIKSNLETIDLIPSGNEDMADKLTQENEFIHSILPKKPVKMSEEEILVIIKTHGVSSIKDVMTLFRNSYKDDIESGKIDLADVSKVVKSLHSA